MNTCSWLYSHVHIASTVVLDGLFIEHNMTNMLHDKYLHTVLPSSYHSQNYHSKLCNSCLSNASHIDLSSIKCSMPLVFWYRANDPSAPQYLTDKLQYVADLSSRCRGRLRSLTSSLFAVRPSRLVTVGDRSFATASPRLWNSLPVDVQSAPSLTTFRHKLKTHLFRQSYPDTVL